MDSKLNRTHIGQQIFTTIGINHLETRVFDGFYIEGPHCLEFGAILQETTPKYRLYYSFDGVGVDIMEHKVHLILTTTNFGTPFHKYVWLFLGQDAVRHIFSAETVAEEQRIRIPDRMMKEHSETIATFRRQVNKIIHAES